VSGRSEGPFHANAGPPEGPALPRDGWPALGVTDGPGGGLIGMAMGGGFTPDPRDPERPTWAAFRLVIGKAEVPGRWACVGRRFVEV